MMDFLLEKKAKKIKMPTPNKTALYFVKIANEKNKTERYQAVNFPLSFSLKRRNLLKKKPLELKHKMTRQSGKEIVKKILIIGKDSTNTKFFRYIFKENETTKVLVQR